MTHTSCDCYDDQQKISSGQAINWCCSAKSVALSLIQASNMNSGSSWRQYWTISQNISSQNKPSPNVNCCCQLYCTCVHMWNSVSLYCTCLVCLCCSKNELSKISFFGYSKCYKNVGNNQLPYYLHILKPPIQQASVSTRTVPGGKHLAPLMLVAKLPVTPMDGRHHPRPTSS